MKPLVLVYFFIFCSISLNAQSDYLLDSTIIRNVFLPNFINVETHKYFYDDQHRLVRKNSKQFNENYTLYSYGSNLIVESQYSKFNGMDEYFLTSTTRRYLNDDQFEIKVEQIYNSEVFLKDSIVLDDRNRIIEKYTLEKNLATNSFNLTQFVENIYENELLLSHSLEYFDSYDSLVNGEYATYEYNTNRLLINEINIWQSPNFGEYIENKKYSYLGETISEIIKTYYFGDNNESVQVERFKYNFPYFTKNEYFIGDGYEINITSENYKHSSSPFFEFDSIQSFNRPLETNNKIFETINSEQFIESKNALRIRNFRNSFDHQGTLVFTDITEDFYKKRNIEVESSEEDFSLFPNPSSTNDLIVIKPISSGLLYNQIVIYNEIGQVVSRVSANSGRYTQFRLSNINAGIYFISLAYNGTIVSLAKKMVVF